MNQKYKVRFNLGKGKHYLMWKVTYPSGAVRYYDPNGTTMMMINGKLKNHRGTAEKIFKGAQKSVCAWIECDAIVTTESDKVGPHSTDVVSYNPRVKPHWVFRDKDCDNKRFMFLFTHKKTVYTYAEHAI